MEFSTGIILGVVIVFIAEVALRVISKAYARKQLRQLAKEYVYKE